MLMCEKNAACVYWLLKKILKKLHFWDDMHSLKSLGSGQARTVLRIMTCKKLAMKLCEKRCHSTQVFGPKKIGVHAIGTLGLQTAKCFKNVSAHSWCG
jgi:hypothetical protein